MNLLKTVLAHPIYRLCWAPLPNTKMVTSTKLALYAVGNGKIIIYNDLNLYNGKLYYILYSNFISHCFE